MQYVAGCCKAIFSQQACQKEEQYARNNFTCHCNFDALRGFAHVASQPAVGLLPERRAGPGPGDSDHPAALGSDLIAELVWCHAPQTLPTA